MTTVTYAPWSSIVKFNPYHDERGRFTDAANDVTGAGGVGATWTGDGGAQMTERRVSDTMVVVETDAEEPADISVSLAYESPPRLYSSFDGVPGYEDAYQGLEQYSGEMYEDVADVLADGGWDEEFPGTEALAKYLASDDVAATEPSVLMRDSAIWDITGDSERITPESAQALVGKTFTPSSVLSWSTSAGVVDRRYWQQYNDDTDRVTVIGHIQPGVKGVENSANYSEDEVITWRPRMTVTGVRLVMNPDNDEALRHLIVEVDVTDADTSVAKYNPYHDERGRFTDASNASVVSAGGVVSTVGTLSDEDRAVFDYLDSVDPKLLRFDLKSVSDLDGLYDRVRSITGDDVTAMASTGAIIENELAHRLNQYRSLSVDIAGSRETHDAMVKMASDKATNTSTPEVADYWGAVLRYDSMPRDVEGFINDVAARAGTDPDNVSRVLMSDDPSVIASFNSGVRVAGLTAEPIFSPSDLGQDFYSDMAQATYESTQAAISDWPDKIMLFHGTNQSVPPASGPSDPVVDAISGPQTSMKMTDVSTWSLSPTVAGNDHKSVVAHEFDRADILTVDKLATGTPFGMTGTVRVVRPSKNITVRTVARRNGSGAGSTDPAYAMIRSNTDAYGVGDQARNTFSTIMGFIDTIHADPKLQESLAAWRNSKS